MFPNAARSDCHGLANMAQGAVGALFVGAGLLFAAPAMAFLGGVIFADYASDAFTGRGLNGWFAKLTGWGNPDAGSVAGQVADAFAPPRPYGYTRPSRY